MNKNDKDTIRGLMKGAREHGEIQVPRWNWHLAELCRSAYPLEFGLDNDIKEGSVMFKREMKRFFLLSKEPKEPSKETELVSARKTQT